MAAETAAQRFARDVAYDTLTSIDNHEDGDVRADRNFKNVPDERSEREYVLTGTNSALETFIDSIQ